MEERCIYCGGAGYNHDWSKHPGPRGESLERAAATPPAPEPDSAEWWKKIAQRLAIRVFELEHPPQTVTVANMSALPDDQRDHLNEMECAAAREATPPAPEREWQWNEDAARSAADMLEQAAKSWRHAEAVSECAHCNALYLARWVKHELSAVPAPPAGETCPHCGLSGEHLSSCEYQKFAPAGETARELAERLRALATQAESYVKLVRFRGEDLRQEAADQLRNEIARAKAALRSASGEGGTHE